MRLPKRRRSGLWLLQRQAILESARGTQAAVVGGVEPRQRFAAAGRPLPDFARNQNECAKGQKRNAGETPRSPDLKPKARPGEREKEKPERSERRAEAQQPLGEQRAGRAPRHHVEERRPGLFFCRAGDLTQHGLLRDLSASTGDWKGAPGANSQ